MAMPGANSMLFSTKSRANLRSSFRAALWTNSRSARLWLAPCALGFLSASVLAQEPSEKPQQPVSIKLSDVSKGTPPQAKSDGVVQAVEAMGSTNREVVPLQYKFESNVGVIFPAPAAPWQANPGASSAELTAPVLPSAARKVVATQTGAPIDSLPPTLPLTAMVRKSELPTLTPAQLPKMPTVNIPESTLFAEAASAGPVVMAEPQLPSRVTAVSYSAYQEPAPQVQSGKKKLLKEEYIGSNLKDQTTLFSGVKIDQYGSSDQSNPMLGNNEIRSAVTEQGPSEWGQDVYTWAAPAFYHNPLYFEQVNLERYGQGAKPWLQPFVAGAHFFATVPVLPYKMGAHQPCDKIYTLGHYRPGNYNPYQIHHTPFTWRGVAYQGAATTGAAFFLP